MNLSTSQIPKPFTLPGSVKEVGGNSGSVPPGLLLAFDDGTYITFDDGTYIAF